MGRVEYQRCLKTDLPTYIPWRVSAGVWPIAALGGQLKRGIKAFAGHSWRWQENGAGSDGKKPPRHSCERRLFARLQAFSDSALNQDLIPPL